MTQLLIHVRFILGSPCEREYAAIQAFSSD